MSVFVLTASLIHIKAEKQVIYLSVNQFEVADVSNIVEELLDMAKNLVGSVKSQLLCFPIHLLKCMYNLNHSSSSWNRTIIEARREIDFD